MRGEGAKVNVLPVGKKIVAFTLSFLILCPALAEIKDKHDYLVCSGPTPWNDYGEFSQFAEFRFSARVKIERHGFAEETLHFYWRGKLKESTKPGQAQEFEWFERQSAKVQYNHSEDGVWYVSDVPHLRFFSRGSPYLHVISSYHRPWDNQWIKVYRQFIPKPPITVDPDPSDWYPYRVDAFELLCQEVPSFDE